MGFVGGGGNISIATALPPSSFVYCILNIKQFMDFLYLIFYGCLRLRFLDVVTKPGQRRPVPDVCRTLCSNVRAFMGTLVTWPWLRLSMIYCCALRIWSQICVTCRRAGSRFLSPCLVVSGQDASDPWDGCIRSRWLRSISQTQIWVWLLRNAVF